MCILLLNIYGQSNLAWLPVLLHITPLAVNGHDPIVTWHFELLYGVFIQIQENKGS